ncbi:serine protease 1-like [Chiloscyllium punctatum]|uniref:serine protease 1-like n=1 Tax=Chiloscyllium punctatum TaxID=137246 RepID=UPI003B63F291
MELLTLALLLGAAVAADDDKIVNGYECPPHSQPWQVFFTTDNSRWCGGSIIDEWWVLSAAHCEKPAHSLVAHIGEHNTDVEEGTEQHIQVAKVISHPSYDYGTIDNDIMLVKLSKPVQFSQYANPIQLSSSCPSAGLQCLVSGWGNVLNNGLGRWHSRQHVLENRERRQRLDFWVTGRPWDDPED